jgi:NAD(P)-dependent dehydrogenase (short-subunit alcohol dehydrogenase family)
MADELKSKATTDTLEGKNILVIGASGGVGTALRKQLADQGAKVHATSRDEAKLNDMTDAASTHTLDALDAKATEDLVKQLAKDGPLHAAVNLAGSVLLKPAHSTKPEEFEEVVRVNLFTAFNLVHAVSRVMPKQETGGSVVLMSSAVASHGFSAHEAITAAKAGVEGLARAASGTYAGKNVRFNCVAPGLARTKLSEKIFQSEPMLKTSLDMHADGQPAEPEQVASAIAWLMHPLQSHVTAQTIAIDGGLSSVHPK